MPLCKEITKKGKQCKSFAISGFDFCHIHSPDCSICCENLISGHTQELHCGHLFHHECIERWIEESHTCPICRSLTDHHIVFDDSLEVSDITRDFMSEVIFGMLNLPLKPISVRITIDAHGRPIFNMN